MHDAGLVIRNVQEGHLKDDSAIQNGISLLQQNEHYYYGSDSGGPTFNALYTISIPISGFENAKRMYVFLDGNIGVFINSGFGYLLKKYSNVFVPFSFLNTTVAVARDGGAQKDQVQIISDKSQIKLYAFEKKHKI